MVQLCRIPRQETVFCTLQSGIQLFRNLIPKQHTGVGGGGAAALARRGNSMAQHPRIKPFIGSMRIRM